MAAKQRFSKDYEQSVKTYDKAHGGGVRDPRFFKPQADKNGRGTITLRFLPSKDTDTDFVKADVHEFNTRAGSFFKESCPKNIGGECGICDYAWSDWKKGDKEHNKPYEKYIPKQKFIMNIVVLKDKETPENEGKVYLWHFGNQIMKKIREQTANGVYPWAWDKGLDFKLKIEQEQFNGSMVPTYKSSYFVDDEAPSPLEADIGDDDLYELTEFTLKSHFKSSEELVSRFEKATGVDTSATGAKAKRSRDDDDDDDDDREVNMSAKKPRASSMKKESREETPVVPDLPFDDDAADADGFVIDDSGDESSEEFFSGIK
jgi:hypothetical protein